MAGLCAFICPGLGHLIVGKPGQALLWFIMIVIGYVALIVPGIVLHIISILDVVRAERLRSERSMERAIRRGMRR